MQPEQQKSILTIALHAAFADGTNDQRERERIRRLAESLANEAGAVDLPDLYQEVLLERTSLTDAAAALVEPAHRRLAYEMAVGVCDADGRTTEAERRFLTGLATLLDLDNGVTEAVDSEAGTMVELLDSAAPAAAVPVPTAVPARAVISETEIDRGILNHAILNGALELLPQSWSSMAIIPLQIKMVYGIGKTYGYELDQGHIRELLATLGIGLTSQYLEQFGRKLLGGLFGKAAGKMARHVGQAATGAAFSFATTYALGQLAKRYYAGGRKMDNQVLRDSFQELLGQAKGVQSRYLPEIQQRANNLDMGQIMAMARGGG